MIDCDVLAQRLRTAAIAVESNGPVTWGRVYDWETARMPRPVEPLEDEDEEARRRAGQSQREEDEHREDAAAARYRAELDALTRRIDADTARLTRIISITCPAKPKTLANRDLLNAQVAAEGLCVSCWRDDQHIKEVELRPERDPDVRAKPYYKDRCRWCGAWKAEHGQDPPLMLLRKHHAPGSRITTADVAKALGRPA